ncbi:hypothetical protein C7T35_28865 [Variovorax sp. WS11]|nr:hypothetical protein C7T35_28865 [Variovorax sp. WS11]
MQEWLAASGIQEGALFRRIRKGGHLGEPLTVPALCGPLTLSGKSTAAQVLAVTQKGFEELADFSYPSTPKDESKPWLSARIAALVSAQGRHPGDRPRAWVKEVRAAGVPAGRLCRPAFERERGSRTPSFGSPTCRALRDDASRPSR